MIQMRMAQYDAEEALVGRDQASHVRHNRRGVRLHTKAEQQCVPYILDFDAAAANLVAPMDPEPHRYGGRGASSSVHVSTGSSDRSSRRAGRMSKPKLSVTPCASRSARTSSSSRSCKALSS